MLRQGVADFVPQEWVELRYALQACSPASYSQELYLALEYMSSSLTV